MTLPRSRLVGGCALEGVDRVFVNSSVGPAILAQKNLIEMAAQAGVRHIVKLSWLGVSERLVSLPFGRWHAEAESHLEASGAAYTILRASAFMQNYLHVIVTPSADTIYGASGEGEVGFVDARDVAAVAARVLEEGSHKGKTCDVTGPEALSSVAVAAVVSNVTGRRVRAVNVSADRLVDNYRRMGWPDLWAEELAAIQVLRAEGRLAKVTDVVERIAGRRPTTFEEFVREFASA